MGKVKRGRQKAHIAAVKSKKEETSNQNVEIVDMESDQVWKMLYLFGYKNSFLCLLSTPRV